MFPVTPPNVHSAQGNDIIYPSASPFALLHLPFVGAISTVVSLQDLANCAGLYWLRLFAIGPGCQRYLSHRSDSTRRVLQFVLAFAAQTSAQEAFCGGPRCTGNTICIPTLSTTRIPHGTKASFTAISDGSLPAETIALIWRKWRISRV